MSPTRVILMSCGSYNPPTNMHLRMFEIARDHLHRMGMHIVVGGVISPVHDMYAKKELASSTHRCAMLKLALHNNDWIRISTWEVRQDGWTKTKLSLQHHQNILNSILSDTNGITHHFDKEDLDWIPENVKNSCDHTPIQIKLLCGADLLESFGTPGLWSDEDIDAIVGQHGLVVITREGSNPHRFIYDSDLLSKYMYNIFIVTEWIPNEVSSTKIRRALKRGESVKYLVQDPVIIYIYKHGIYDTSAETGTTTIKLELSSNDTNNYLNVNSKYQNAFLTPSPSDVTMGSPSPVEIISIDVPNSVLRKNLQNSSTFSTSQFTNLDDTDQLREKFISAISENGNKLLTTLKTTYPGQAKQIIATETGESQILDEVGLNDDDKKAFNVETSSKEHVSQKNDKYLDSMYRVNNESCKVLDDSYCDDDNERKLLIVAKINCYEGKADLNEEKQKELELGCRNNDSNNDGGSLRVTSSNVNEAIESLVTVVDFDHAVSNVNINKIDVTCESTVETKAKNNFNNDVVSNDQDESLDYKNDRNTDVNWHNSPDSLLYEKNEHCKDDSFYDHTRKSVTSVTFKGSTGENSETCIVNIEGNVKAEMITNDMITVNSTRNNDMKFCTRDKLEEKVDIVNEDTCLIENNIETNREEQIMEKQELRGTNIEPCNVDTKFRIEKRSVECVSGVDKLEIDGKYLQSLVNSRKSPKKLKNKTTIKSRKDDVSSVELQTELQSNLNSLIFEGTSVADFVSKVETRCLRRDIELARDSGKSDDELIINDSKKKKKKKKKQQQEQCCDSFSRGSLDCINVTKPKTSEITKKSKSYEFIKSNTSKSLRTFNALKPKSSCTLRLIGANNLDERTNDFCTECCYANILSVNADSPECDICCNVCHLQDPTAILNYKTLPVTEETSCEFCEFCADSNKDFTALSDRELADVMDRRIILSKNLSKDVSIDKIDGDIERDSFEDDFFVTNDCDLRSKGEGIVKRKDEMLDYEESIDECDRHDPDSDQFEIENCGLDVDLNNVEHPRSSVLYKSVDEKFGHRMTDENPKTLKEFVPKDETDVTSKGAKQYIRKGSSVKRIVTQRSQDKRRYSSVDNLQCSKTFFKGSDKFVRVKGSKLIASADNIRSENSRSGKGRKLQKSADDVGRIETSMDNLHPLEENLDDDGVKNASSRPDRRKVRDNDMVKMILTKHGIKIISEKETAL